MQMRRTSIPVVALLLSISHSVTAQTFYDGTFDPASWNTSQTMGAGGQTFSQEQTGGNPDEYFRAQTITNSPVIYAHINQAFTIDPFETSIESIDFSIDIQNFVTFGQGMGFALALEQNGSVFFGPGQITSSADTSQWVDFSQLALVESQFERQTGSADLDFSSSGSPITFGFRTANSNGNTITTGYDNYAVTVNVVPESSAPLLVWMLSLAIAYRKRPNR